jgi:hypothetical protein
MWSAVRWQTFNLMAAQAGSKALHEAGIYKPTDLIQFPWDEIEQSKPLTDDERTQLQAEMDAMNAELAKQKE